MFDPIIIFCSICLVCSIGCSIFYWREIDKAIAESREYLNRLKKERIVKAAIRYNGKVYSVPAPGRHCNVTWLMAEEGLGLETMHDQGFVTSTGRFVDREEAFKIARKAGQIKVKTSPAHILFSEDVW